MKKQLLLFLFFSFFIIFTTEVKAQKLKTLIANGDEAFAQNDFFGAALYYNQAILKDSLDINIQYKYAEASRLNYDYDIADRWYNKAYKQDKQSKLYPECVFWLAMIKKTKGKYKEAKALFTKYVQKNKKNKNSYLLKKAQQEVAACDHAQWLVSNPDKKVNITHLDTSVNSKVSEYAPFQVDSVLYFSSLRNSANRDKKNYVNYNKIYTSIEHENSTHFEKAKELDSLFNQTNIHNANTSFNADHDRMYITRCKQKNALEFTCNIFVTKLKDSIWSPLELLPPEINEATSTNTQPAIGYLGDQEVLFFSSDRKGGEGKMDIWYSKITDDSIYEKPINAGKKVNTVEDDISPFYCKPCQELFFSSTWHKGLGGFDIFKSNYKDSAGTFSEPQNLGVPVNSSYNDIYFSINTEETKAFLSSNRIGSYFEEKESCCNDIYMFALPTDSASLKKKKKSVPVDSTQVFVSQMKLLVPLTLFFHNDEPDRKTLATTTTKNYKTTYENYTAMREIYKNGFSLGVKPKDKERAIADIDELFDDSIDAGMRNLEEFSRLLVKVLNDKEKVTITMKGYCSPLASTSYNTNLAKRRISSLKNYFTEYENGIFVPYINNEKPDEGNITFVEEEVGELKSTKVSDDYYDVKNSIYNPLAAFERKIQIIAISTTSGKLISDNDVKKTEPIKDTIPSTFEKAKQEQQQPPLPANSLDKNQTPSSTFQSNYYWVTIATKSKGNIIKLKEKIAKTTETSFVNDNLVVSKEPFDISTDIILVKVFTSEEKAKEYYNFMLTKKQVFEGFQKGGWKSFVISADDYLQLQKDKDVKKHLQPSNEKQTTEAIKDKAQPVLEVMKQQPAKTNTLTKKQIQDSLNQSDYYWITLATKSKGDVNKLQEKIKKITDKNFASANLNVSIDTFDISTDIVLVNVFTSKTKTMKYYKFMSTQNQVFAGFKKGGWKSFIISAENYLLLQKDKDVKKYLQLSNQNIK